MLGTRGSVSFIPEQLRTPSCPDVPVTGHPDSIPESRKTGETPPTYIGLPQGTGGYRIPTTMYGFQWSCLGPIQGSTLTSELQLELGVLPAGFGLLEPLVLSTVYPFGVLAWNDLIWFLANGKALCDCSVGPGLSLSFPPHITCRASRYAIQKLCKSFQHPHLGPSTDTVPRSRRNPRFNDLHHFTAQRRRGPGACAEDRPNAKGKAKATTKDLRQAASDPFIW
ncbi:uncharacterized protein CLUP02_05776 [Colletotrichum lupini]|uniref:Uncharacterized protein n=1 Tax=Colletotrichum lupini TaxID=145971 RepID=A0A9Q8SN44_9PEZI|nr:uncharacterized protein CLUP02_05776 [Colletotrichum lupini]UQC80293.1 hypothetical protein CLUP02_05776 [Colletotrichum lupini]